VLQPSLMDGALQACIGLMDRESTKTDHPRLPFALERLRIVSACRPKMYAWVRFAPDCQATDRVVKLDIDLCDEYGNVCVQMRGLSTQVSDPAIDTSTTRTEIEAPALQTDIVEGAADTHATEYSESRIDSGGLIEKTQDYLRKQFSGLLKVPSHKIDPQAALEEHGIDSILVMKLTKQLEKTFGSLSKVLFFECKTIRQLAEYFVAHYSAQLTGLFDTSSNPINQARLSPASTPVHRRSIPSRRFSRRDTSLS